MSLRQITAAATVAVSLTLTSIAPAHAGMPVVTPTASNDTAEKALVAFALIGLVAWITGGFSGTGSAASGATVTQSGGNTSGSFSILKF